MWDTLALLPEGAVPKSYRDSVNTMPQCESFMHLHLGFDAEVRDVSKTLQFPFFSRSNIIVLLGEDST